MFVMNEKIIKKLFNLADKSLKNEEFPVAAIIYKDDKIISCGYNKRKTSHLTTDHAEIIAIQKANKKLKNWKLTNVCMVVTLEPCDMCKTVIKESRIEKVYYLVPRYSYKKQYKCTTLEELKLDSKLKDKYLDDIKAFFVNKR